MARKETGAARFDGLQQGQFYTPDDYSRDEFTTEGGLGSSSIAYSNLRSGTPRPSDSHVWFSSSYAGGSVYSGTSVEKSNYKVLLEEAERLAEELGDDSWYQTFYGSHGTFDIAFHVEKTPDEIVEMLSALEDYPVLDEGAMSELESEEEAEAWDNSYREDYRRALEAEFDGDADDVDDDVLFDHFREWSDAANEYWEHTQEGPYIDVGPIAEKAAKSAAPPEGMKLFFEVHYFVTGSHGPAEEQLLWIKATSVEEAKRVFTDLLDAGDARIWGDTEGARVERDGEDRIVKFGLQQQRTIGGDWDPAAFTMIRVGEIANVGETGVEEEDRLIENRSMRANPLRRKLSSGTTVELTLHRYGFSAWLLSISGKDRLPISMPGHIRSADEAFAHALAQVQRASSGRSVHYVGPAVIR